MKGKSYRILQLLLGSVSAFHVVVGAGLNLFPRMPETMARAYGATLQLTPQFAYILKPLGAFMFVLGILAAAAALNPVRLRAVTYTFALLFVVRALQRLVHAQEIFDSFAISSGRNLSNMVFFLALAAVLVTFDQLVQRQARSGEPAMN